MAQLPLVEQYAAMELFRGSLVRHSAILYRDDSPASPLPLSFEGEAWLDYVPIRLPDTICVQERLPPGAAAVLINQAHTNSDLFMPINTIEMRWYAAIDGVRPIGEILAGSPSASPEPARLKLAPAFFERLWWYDQVVFAALSSLIGKQT
jgi:hypothetical protein